MSKPAISRSAGASNGDAPGAGTARMGLRERHKMEKVQRISAATIKLFGRDGFDATTLREIATEADVALGTLALYARDKRDLVLMIFNKIIPPLFEEGYANVRPEGHLTDNLVGLFEPCYRAYANDITLYRVVLRHIYNFPGSLHADENTAIRTRVLGYLADILAIAVERGECREDVDMAVHARSFFYLYFSAVRVWLFYEDPKPAQGLANLRELYVQHIRGVAPGT